MRIVRRFLLFALPIFFITTLFAPSFILAEGTTISAQSLLPKVRLYFPTRTGTFTEGTTFEVPIILNTNNTSVNTVEVYIEYDPHKLAIIKPAGDKSIISIWLQPPSFSNTDGRAKIVGAIPNGISTESGVVTTITFKALETGEATVRIAEGSRILANNGAGTDLLAQFDSAHYTIQPVPPEGLKVYSETHPFDDHWYNNNSPVLSWEADPKISGVSYVFDHEPFTIPDNSVDSTLTTKSYENVEDGIWYFHIKAQKNKIWGATTHFLVRIDTTPPAEFTPMRDSLAGNRLRPTLVSFFTTDAFSGVDHYEVGVVENDSSSTPLFVQTDSPYKVPPSPSGSVKVLIKAYDRAGNVRLASTEIQVTNSIVGFLSTHINTLVMGLLVLILLMVILHYVFKHRIFHKDTRTTPNVPYPKVQIPEPSQPKPPFSTPPMTGAAISTHVLPELQQSSPSFFPSETKEKLIVHEQELKLQSQKKHIEKKVHHTPAKEIELKPIPLREPIRISITPTPKRTPKKPVYILPAEEGKKPRRPVYIVPE